MRLALLGDPVTHSLSPAIQSAAFAASHLPGTYEARRVDATGMQEAVEELRSGGLDGANVTMPHKRLAVDLCDRVELRARQAGAANTLVRVGAAVIGHNTDVGGVRVAWRRAELPTGAPVLVLGTGGAAAAALLAVASSRTFVSGRREGAGAELARRVGVAASEIPWGEGIRGAVVVNATPLGMDGEELPERVLEGAAGLFDMAYGSGPTPAAEAFRRRGAPVAEGTDMLIAQAAESFRLWTGRRADQGAMWAAAAAQLAEIREGSGPAT